MQDQAHHQQPMLFLVPVSGEAKAVEELEEEVLADIAAAAERGLKSLAGSSSPCLRFLRVVLEQADLAASSAASRVRLIR